MAPHEIAKFVLIAQYLISIPACLIYFTWKSLIEFQQDRLARKAWPDHGFVYESKLTYGDLIRRLLCSITPFLNLVWALLVVVPTFIGYLEIKVKSLLNKPVVPKR